MIAKHELIASLQDILTLQQDLPRHYRQLADWQPPGATTPPQHREFTAACRSLEQDSLRQTECLENLCAAVARGDRHDY